MPDILPLRMSSVFPIHGEDDSRERVILPSDFFCHSPTVLFASNGDQFFGGGGTPPNLEEGRKALTRFFSLYPRLTESFIDEIILGQKELVRQSIQEAKIRKDIIRELGSLAGIIPEGEDRLKAVIALWQFTHYHARRSSSLLTEENEFFAEAHRVFESLHAVLRPCPSIRPEAIAILKRVGEELENRKLALAMLVYSYGGIVPAAAIDLALSRGLRCLNDHDSEFRFLSEKEETLEESSGSRSVDLAEQTTKLLEVFRYQENYLKRFPTLGITIPHSRCIGQVLIQPTSNPDLLVKSLAEAFLCHPVLDREVMIITTDGGSREKLRWATLGLQALLPTFCCCVVEDNDPLIHNKRLLPYFPASCLCVRWGR